MPNIVNIGKNIGLFLKRNSSTILTGIGAAGVVSTAVLSGKAAIKAHDDIQEVNQSIRDEGCSDVLDLKGKVILTWKYFIPPVLMGATSMACIIGAQTVNVKRHAALASLYTLTEQTLAEYKEKIIENFEQKGLQKIQEDIDEDHIRKIPGGETHIIIPEKTGEIVCFDIVSGRYFKSDMETLRRIQNDINQDVINTMWSSLNDFYYVLGLENIKIGDDLGWTPDKMMNIRFDSKLLDGKPIMVIDYEVTPFSYL